MSDSLTDYYENPEKDHGDWDVRPSIPKRKYCVGHAKGLETLTQKMSDALEGTTEYQDLIDEFHRFQIRWIE
ncbi:hypothetical protein RND59_05565 [Vibrio ruber]|uniref:hypothetical protein n=1 Tax=Vibrio ruber TaxID=184755 RepID=UPI0028931F0E|nr:hypothetical protein [Vibrio ruber]WNJ96564.1 hypothetical protein RND59_05565 [Vibrio ruber]